MAKKFRIVRVKDNDRAYYVIKVKHGFFGKWETHSTGKFVFHEHCGWRLKAMEFKDQESAEKFLRDELMPHDISEYVVKEYTKSLWNFNIINRDKTKDEYVNNLNGRWGKKS